MNKSWNQQSPNMHFINSPYRDDTSTKKKQMNDFDINNMRRQAKATREMHEPVWEHLYN